METKDWKGKVTFYVLVMFQKHISHAPIKKPAFKRHYGKLWKRVRWGSFRCSITGLCLWMASSLGLDRPRHQALKHHIGLVYISRSSVFTAVERHTVEEITRQQRPDQAPGLSPSQAPNSISVSRSYLPGLVIKRDILLWMETSLLYFCFFTEFNFTTSSTMAGYIGQMRND